MLEDKLLVPLITDIAFGITFMLGIVAYLVSNDSWLPIVFTIGVMIGYAIHTASHMLGYSVNTNLVDKQDVDTET